MIIPESFHSASDDLPWADNWAGDPGIRLKLLMADIEGGRYAVRMLFAPGRAGVPAQAHRRNPCVHVRRRVALPRVSGQPEQPGRIVPVRTAGQHAHAQGGGPCRGPPTCCSSCTARCCTSGRRRGGRGDRRRERAARISGAAAPAGQAVAGSAAGRRVDGLSGRRMSDAAGLAAELRARLREELSWQSAPPAGVARGPERDRAAAIRLRLFHRQPHVPRDGRPVLRRGRWIEIGQRGRYYGKERIHRFLLEVLGDGRWGLLRDEVINHVQQQPIITDRRRPEHARGRARAPRCRAIRRPIRRISCSRTGSTRTNTCAKDGHWKIRGVTVTMTFYAALERARIWFPSAPPSEAFPPDAPSQPVGRGARPAVQPVALPPPGGGLRDRHPPLQRRVERGDGDAFDPDRRRRDRGLADGGLSRAVLRHRAQSAHPHHGAGVARDRHHRRRRRDLPDDPQHAALHRHRREPVRPRDLGDVQAGHPLRRLGAPAGDGGRDDHFLHPFEAPFHAEGHSLVSYWLLQDERTRPRSPRR